MKRPYSLCTWLTIFAIFGILMLGACTPAGLLPTATPAPFPFTPVEPSKIVSLVTATVSAAAVQPGETSPTPTPSSWKTSSDQTPMWLAAPGGNDVALISLCGLPEQCELVFVNSGTTETYTITVPEGADYYFWLPDTPSGPSGMKLGLVYLPDSLVIYRLANGAVEEKQFETGALRYLADASSSNTLMPVFSFGNPGETDWFLTTESRVVSFDRRYVLRQDWSNPETPILIDNLKTGNSFQVTNGADGRYDAAYDWSPVDDVLAILQSSEPPMPSVAGQVAFQETHLLVYNVTGQSIEAGGGIRMASVNWQSDGKKILFLSGTTPEVNNLPCWLDLATGSALCADSIPKADPAEYITDLAWLRGQNRIIFLQHSPSTQANQLCVYDLESTETSCKVRAVEGRKITGYKPGPDGKVVFFTHDTLSSSADSPETPYATLASLDGVWSVDLAGKEVYDRFGWNPALVGVLWRPK